MVKLLNFQTGQSRFIWSQYNSINLDWNSITCITFSPPILHFAFLLFIEISHIYEREKSLNIHLWNYPTNLNQTLQEQYLGIPHTSMYSIGPNSIQYNSRYFKQKIKTDKTHFISSQNLLIFYCKSIFKSWS